MAGEDWRPVGEARLTLLAAAGGERTDAAAVWGDGTPDCRATGGDQVGGIGRQEADRRGGDVRVRMEVIETMQLANFEVLNNGQLTLRGGKVLRARKNCGVTARKGANECILDQTGKHKMEITANTLSALNRTTSTEKPPARQPAEFGGIVIFWRDHISPSTTSKRADGDPAGARE